MTERRALLADMYKISEEDSQDEEVLSSLSSKVTVSLTVTTEGNSNAPMRVKPVPPLKPLFLRKGCNTINNNTIQTSVGSSGSREKLPDNDKTFSAEGKSSSTSIFHRLTSSSEGEKEVYFRQPSHQSHVPESVKWPSNCSSTSSSDSENSGEVLSVNDSYSRNESRTPMASDVTIRDGQRSQRYKDMKGKVTRRQEGKIVRSERKVLGSNVSNQRVRRQETETDDEDSGSSTASESHSCSSCDNQEDSSRRALGSQETCNNFQSDDNASTASYSTQNSTTDHPYSDESNFEYGDDDDGSDNIYEEEVAALVNEVEIQSWTAKDGNMFFCEYFSTRNSPEMSESANEEAGVAFNSKSKSIHSSYLSTPLGTQESDSTSLATIETQEKGQKTYKGKISRLLKRSKVSNENQGRREVPQDLELPQGSESSLKTRQLVQNALGSSGSGSNTVAKGQTPKGKAGNVSREKVFRFKDEHDGEIRQVELCVTSFTKHNLGRRATMVESLLGIIPSRFSSPPTSASNTNATTFGNHQQQNSLSAVSDRVILKSTTTQPSSSNDGSNSRTEIEDKRIMVSGFIPDGPAARNKSIKIGDWLQSVNGISVNFSNVNSVLLEVIQQLDSNQPDNISIKICLELQRVSGYTVTDVPSKNAYGESRSTNQFQFGHHSEPEIPPETMSKIVIIYISTINSVPTTPVPKEKTKDVIFCWPRESESRKVKSLSSSHGMFSTLYQLLKDVTGSHPISSRVMIDDEEMDVIFTSDDDGKGLLLLATAAVLSNFNICQSQSFNPVYRESLKKEKKLRWKDPVNGGLLLAERILTRIVGLLNYQFGNLSRAFRDTSEETLNQFFSRVICGLTDISEDFLFPQVPDHFLHIPTRIRCVLDERLYSFESSDSFSLTYGRNCKTEGVIYNCLGSCLFYKGMAITSHLERSLASHFNGWWRTQLGLWGIKRNTLPCVWNPVKRLILWQQTFMQSDSKRLDEDSSNSSNERESLMALPCYSVLLGLGNYMLGMVLECATPNLRHETADIGWIQRGFNCIMRVLACDAHTSLDKWIFNLEDEFIELYPPQGSTKRVHSSQSGIKVSQSNSKHPHPGPSSILKNTDIQLAAENSNQQVISNSSKSLEISSESGTTTNYQDYSYHYGLSSVASSGNTIADRLSFENSNDEEELEDTATGTSSDTSSFKLYYDEFSNLIATSYDDDIQTLSVTKGNVLFDFIQIEHGRMILLTSKDTLEGPFSVVIHNFRQSATVSHHILHKAENGRARFSQQMNDKKWISKALTPISEHGILFNCDVVDPRDAQKRKPRLRQVSYWVIGRIYPNQREVYICYQDSSVAQNVLEVAFKLAYAAI